MSDTVTAEIFGQSWRQGPIAEFPTVREARKWAESFGVAADKATIRRGKKSVAEHRRDTSGDGRRWFKAVA